MYIYNDAHLLNTGYMFLKMHIITQVINGLEIDVWQRG